MMAPIPLAEAHSRLLADARALGTERLPVERAHGRYLAAPLLARRTQPAADLSAMDGFAVGADDLDGPWQVVGRSAAGRPFAGTLLAGQAVRIGTGALMPAGAGAVLVQEQAQRDGDRLALAHGGAPTASYVRRAGLDFTAGDTLLPAGTRIGPAQLALALAAGHAALEVGRLPTVAVLDSGDELLAGGEALAPHQIPASNGAMLAAMAAPLAASVQRLGPVADQAGALATALAQADSVDVLVTSGGASVGDHDLIRPALEQWGASIAFWRVAMKPGKPLLVARRGEQWVLGLPGNPVSAYVTSFLFLLPLLRALAGARTDAVLARPVAARLLEPLPATGPRQEFVRAVLTSEGVRPLPQQDSSALATLGHATALIERQAGAPEAPSGSMVQVYLLDNVGNA